jgi:N-methylhydantoinase B
VAARYRAGELDIFDLVRQYGVIVDWGSGELFTETTKAYRGRMMRRSAAHWKQRPSASRSKGEAAE